MENKSNKSISYIIAAYNEEDIIGDTIEHCINCLKKDFDDFELILVDDGSVDDTLEIMIEKSKIYKNIVILKNIVNLNFGTAVQRGMSIATKDFVIYNAVDLPLSPKKTGKLINLMDEVDVLVLQRKEYLGTNKWRKIISLINRTMVYILFPIVKKGLRDTNYTQIFRKEIVKNILPISRGPIFTWPEMIFRARYAGLRVKTINIEYNPRTVRKGAFGKPNDIIWGIYEMLRFRMWKFGKT